ncbi:Por secretion system C-terminal sorting domain-containing protein [Reichenbachiella faecimaris]|uniref:Por secretion system C-terminal sorting domain-containing protein n=1 Tax=Reichenbachiella faecimaris TaxID=692418 RepID=A0A1W2GJH5_REIFA|nr:T9SS type A sorting domain-containing protein [Reichenbachiella faecimaris]SMD36823.1 Por secretion system C-terminal sorting domain-containing protein [Reichenbachiella faecimaris]
MRKPILATTLVALLVSVFLIKYGNKKTEERNPYISQIEKYEKVKNLSYEEIKNLPKRDRPDLALLQEFETTKDLSLGYPPVQKKIKAFDLAKEKLAKKASTRAIAGVEWAERGPNNVGGRTRALMFDPNDDTNKKVWAGGVSGGIWYIDDITDEDAAWTNVDDFMANLSISSLAHDPNATATFYAGTGERWTRDFRGTGIWKSTDSGASWNQLSNTEDFGYTSKIVITSNSVIVAATSTGIKISDDGGDTWDSPSDVNVDMSDVEVGNDDILYCAGFVGNIFKSSNEGSSWTSVSPDLGGDRVEVAIAPSNSNKIYAASEINDNVGWMASSSDGGSSWTQITIPMYLEQGTCESDADDFSRGQAWYDLILAVNPSDESEVIVGGIDLHKSSDGGSTWTAISYWTGACAPFVHADQHAITFKPGSSSEAIFGNDGGVFYSSNIDQSEPTFAARNNNYNVTQFYAVALNNSVNSNDMLAGSQDNGSQKFSDFGVNSTIEATGGDGAYCFIDQDDPSIQITSYVFNNYYLSRDGGTTFEAFGTGNTGGFINQGDYDSEANILYARSSGGNSYNKYTITETGIESSTVNISIGGTPSHFMASPYEDNVLYIGTSSGTVNKIEDANASTPSVTEILAISGTITSIDLADNGSKILVTVGNYGANSSWYSEDSGENWIDIEGDLPDMPVWWGMFNPLDNNQVILATEVGVWTSDDITLEDVIWEPSNEGLANVSSRMLQYRESDGAVAVATHGRGVFTSFSFSNVKFADFTADLYVAYEGNEIDFTNKSNGTITDYAWSTSDGGNYTTEDITHSFSESGWQTVTLQIDDSESITKNVFVIPNRPVNYLIELENEPGDTYVDNVRGLGFELGNSNIDGKDGVTSGEYAWVVGPDEENYANRSRAYIYTPWFDFTSDGTYEFSFNANYTVEEAWDGFIVEYTTDGESWEQLSPTVATDWYDIEAVVNDNYPDEGWPVIPLFSGTTDGDYVTKTRDISDLSGNSFIAFRFHWVADAAAVEVGVAIDDIQITGPDNEVVPNFTISYEEEYCNGTPLYYYSNSSIAAASYSWDFGSDASPATASGKGPHEVNYSTTGSKTASLTITDSDENSFIETKTDFLQILETMTNTATIALAEPKLCPGETTTVQVTNSEVGKNYTLYTVGSNNSLGDSQEGNGATLNFDLGSNLKSEEYFIEIYQDDSHCTSYSEELNLEVSEIAETSISSTEFELCAGEVVSINISNSIEGLIYQFIDETLEQPSGSNVTGNGDLIVLSSAELTSGTELSILVTDSDCELTFESTVNVTVNSYPDVTITESDFELSVADGAENYEWFKDGAPISGATLNTYEVTLNGSYHVIASNGECESTSDVMTVIVADVADDLFSYDIYPNPSKGMLNFAGKGHLEMVKIYSLSGNLVMLKESNSEPISQLDVAQLERGIYILETVSNSKSSRQKIILEK